MIQHTQTTNMTRRNYTMDILTNEGYIPVGGGDIGASDPGEVDFFKNARSLGVLPREDVTLVITYGRVIGQQSPHFDRETVLAQDALYNLCLENGLSVTERFAGEAADLDAFVEVVPRLEVLRR